MTWVESDFCSKEIATKDSGTNQVFKENLFFQQSHLYYLKSCLSVSFELGQDFSDSVRLLKQQGHTSSPWAYYHQDPFLTHVPVKTLSLPPEVLRISPLSTLYPYGAFLEWASSEGLHLIFQLVILLLTFCCLYFWPSLISMFNDSYVINPWARTSQGASFYLKMTR